MISYRHTQSLFPYMSTMILVAILLIAGSVSADDRPSADLRPASRTYTPGSSLALQFGGAFVTGDWFDRQNGGITFEVSARVQMSGHYYVGLLYYRQTIDPNSGVGIPTYPYFSYSMYYPERYRQHEIYAVVGTNSDRDTPRDRFYFLEVGGGMITYHRELVYNYYRLDSHTDFGVRLAWGIVQPLSDRFGVIFTMNSRCTGEWAGGDSDFGLLVGANLGILLLSI